MFKPSQSKSDKYSSLLQQLFDKTIENPNAYQTIYVYNYVTQNYIIFKQNITTNYVIGYTPDYEKFVLLQFADVNEDGNLVAGQAAYFNKQDIISFKRNLFGRYVLKLQNGKQYKFYIQPFISDFGSAYMLPLLQEEKVANFLKSI